MTNLRSADWHAIVSEVADQIPVAVGAVAEDRESDKRVLVIDLHDEPADDWRIDTLGMTVAEANPEYPSDDPVATAVYLEALPDECDARYTFPLALDIRRSGDWTTYDFPESRLESVAPDRLSLGDFKEAPDHD